MQRAEEDWVKENKPPPAVLSSAWLLAGLALSVGALLAALAVDLALPAPLPRRAALDTPERFVAELAHDHLVNLTAVGPRVAGSYENEVVTVAVLVAAIRRIAEQASPHNRVELDVQRASGSFALAFMDGMNHVYRDVQNVVARVRGAGGAARAAGRSALLLNCHFDSVPDSPGASDDGAGCAVMLETLRALAATGRPLRHDAIFLFNGAEENILQASHAFITQHKWARSVRAFINIEACGAGGREVMFQAGPFDPWIIEVYAGAVPHPFASSLAQELFQSGAIPADTDFRIFRDFGKLSGVDLAWSANGYVYHTRLDTAERVPPAALQRTGDNVLALARGLLASPRLAQAADPQERTPAFFDVLGLVLVVAGPRAAVALAAAALALLALKVHANARAAQRQLYVAYGAWWRFVLAGAATLLLAGAGGALAAAGAGALLHAAGARLTFYSRPWLLAVLFALPGVAAGWALLAALWRAALRRAAGGGLLRRGWWGARALHDAAALLAGGALAACAARGLRSGFLPLLWVLLPSAADAAASAARLRGGARACLWVAGAALPLLQTAYLLVNTLRMFVPIMGRAGAQTAPPDVVMALLTVALAQLLLSWLLPFVGAARDVPRLARWLGALGGAALLLALSGGAGAPYGAATPQRLMLFHTRRTVHAPPAPPAPPDHFYWAPELDANTLRALRDHVGAAAALGAAECARAPYCGAPYYLPVLALVGRSYAVAAPAAPRARLHAALRVTRAAGARSLWLNVTRAPQHVVLIVAPAPGVALARVAQAGVPEGAAPLAGAAWGARRTYFYSLHAARAPAAWALELRFEGGGARLADVSLAGHAMFGADSLHEAHAALLRRLPPAVAATGWGVDLHLYEL